MNTIDDVAKEWEQFQLSNDKRLSEMQKGIDDPLLKEQIDKHSEELGEIFAKAVEQEKLIKAEQERNDALELKVNRGHFGGGAGIEAQEMIEAKQFFALVQKKDPEEVTVDIEGYRNYKEAFNQYLRQGDKGLGIMQALEVGSDPAGGYWVVPDKGGAMQELIYETSPMRQLASVVTIGTDALEGINDLNTGVSGGWVGEIAARGETNTPDVGEYRITVREQFANPKASQKVLDDSMFDVEGWLAAKTADIISRTENTAFITGDGILRPRGILDYGHGIPSATTWNVIERTPSTNAGAFAATDPGDDLVTLVFSLKSDYRANARWLMSRSTVSQVRQLKDGNGNYLWQPNFTNLQETMLIGFPISEGEDMPAIAANSLSIAFGDFRRAYTIVDRAGIRVLRDPYTDKPHVLFYTTKRVGGDVVNFEAIKLFRFAVAAE